MSYHTFKTELTGASAQNKNLKTALDDTLDHKNTIVGKKDGIISTIFVEAIDIMSEYMRARQNYLNDYEKIHHAFPAGVMLEDGTAIHDKAEYEFRTPITHVKTDSSSTTSLSHNDNQYYGVYNTYYGSIKNWAIEKWTVYIISPKFQEEDSSVHYKLSGVYVGNVETYSDVNHTRLAEVTAAPYSLDGAGRHSLTNLTHIVTSFDAGMDWIWGTTNQYLSANNPWWGPYNVYGIESSLEMIEYSIAATRRQIEFTQTLIDLDSQY